MERGDFLDGDGKGMAEMCGPDQPIERGDLVIEKATGAERTVAETSLVMVRLEGDDDWRPMVEFRKVEMRPALGAAALKEKLENGYTTVVTTDGWHYSANAPVTIGPDYIEFTVGAGDARPIIRLPMGQIADVRAG